MSTSKDVLKTYFQSGDFPTEEQFGELIDSLQHVDDVSAISIRYFDLYKLYSNGIEVYTERKFKKQFKLEANEVGVFFARTQNNDQDQYDGWEIYLFRKGAGIWGGGDNATSVVKSDFILMYKSQYATDLPLGFRDEKLGLFEHTPTSEFLKSLQANKVDRSELNTAISMSAYGIKYAWNSLAERNSQTGMKALEQGVQKDTREVFRYTGNAWELFYTLDAVHNHNDLYYQKGESDARFLGKTAKATDSDKLDGKDSSAFADAIHNHNDLYYTETESDARFLGKTDKAADSDKLDGKDSAAFADATHNHNDLYYTETESDARFLGKTAKASDSDKLDGKDSSAFADATHNHNDLYYTEIESDARFLGKTDKATDSDKLDGKDSSAFADATHNHNDLYYTETESDALFLGKTDKAADSDKLDGKDSTYFVALTSIVNDLTSTAENQPLSAKQGKVLKSLIDDINTLLSSNDTSLDEIQEIVNYIKQNKSDLDSLSVSNIAGLETLLNTKESKFSKNSAFNKNFGTGEGTVAEGNHEHNWDQINGKPTSFPASKHHHNNLYYEKGESNTRFLGKTAKATDSDKLNGKDSTYFVALTSIVNDLTSTAENQPLSAKQGKVLKDLIDNINTLLSSNDTTLDDIQEIVNYIKQNKNDLENLSVSNIAGLEALLNGKEPKFNKNSAFNKSFGTAKGTVAEGDHTHTWNQVTGKPTSFPASSHDHNDLYYTETESDARFLGKTSKAVDSDKLDGKDSSAFANASHNHNDLYYTESESDARFLGKTSKAVDSDKLDGIDSNGYAKQEIIPAKTLNKGWYTIAINSGDRASAKFVLKETRSSYHQAVHFYAGHHFGRGNVITVLSNSYHASEGSLKYLRIKEGGTYDGAMLQVYINVDGTPVQGIILEDIQSSGWQARNWIPEGTDPKGVSNFGALTNVAVQVDLNNTQGIQSTQELFINNNKVYHEGHKPTAADIGALAAGSKAVDSDKLNGLDSTAFAKSSHNHNDLYYTETESDARFLGKTAKATDSDKLDGKDSTYFVALTNIVDNLTSTAENQPLSAKQGKVLKDLIDNINTLLSSNDTSLDDLQEVVNYIKQNKSDLDSLSVSNIAGLEALLNGKESKFSKNSAFNKNFGTAKGTVAEGSHSHSWGQITGKPTSFPASSHNHNDLYYTESESDARFLGKTAKATDSDKLDGLDSSAFARSSHNHNDLYYTESESNARFLGKTAKATDSDKLDGLDSSAFARVSHNHNDLYYTESESNARFLGKTAKASDSDKLDGLDSSAFARVSHNHNGLYYTESESNARFLGKTAKAADSDKLDGLDSSAFAKSSHNHNDLYYTESESNTRFLGKTAKATDSDKLDGLDSSAFARVSHNHDDRYKRQYTQTIEVKGEADKYYQVVFKGGNQNRIRELNIYRSFGEKAPTTWNTSTHRGGLTAEFRLNAGGWGGAEYNWKLLDFRESYTTILADAGHTSHNTAFYVMLRGGGAIYHIDSDDVLNIQIAYSSSDIIYPNSNPAYVVRGRAPITTINSVKLLNHKIPLNKDVLLKTAKATDSDKLDGLDSSAFARTSHNHNDLYYTEAESNARFLGKTAKAADSDKLDGLNSTHFLRSDTHDTASGQYTFTKVNGHAIKVGTIRGLEVNAQKGQFIQLYERVNIGYPSGWGNINASAPSNGLGVYGSVEVGQNGSGTLKIGGNTFCGGHLYGKSVNGAYSNLYRFGGVYFTWDSDSYGTNAEHSIRSTYGNSYSDSLTMNSFNNIRLNIDSNNNNSNSKFEIGNNTTGTSNVLFSLDETGVVRAKGDIIAFSTSDKNLKDNIKPIASPLTKINQLSGNEFTWNKKQNTYDEGSKDYGVVAQEVASILPEAVRKNEETGYLSVRYEKLIPLLIEGMKEQQEQIEALKTKLYGTTE